MAPQLPASALAAISGYVDREEPAGPPAPAAAPPVPAPALDREEPAAPPPVPPPARDREEQTLREIEPLDASAVFALLHPDGPGYAVVDGVLGQEAARRAARAALPAGDEGRGTLPDRCDKEWFKNAFCGGHPDVDKRTHRDPVWDLIKSRKHHGA